MRRGGDEGRAIREVLRAAVGRATQPRLRAIGVGEGPGWISQDVDRALAESGFGD